MRMNFISLILIPMTFRVEFEIFVSRGQKSNRYIWYIPVPTISSIKLAREPNFTPSVDLIPNGFKI